VRREALRKTYGREGTVKLQVADRTQDKPVPVFPPCPD